MSEADALPESGVLFGALRYQREHALGTVEELSQEQMRRLVLPTGWNIVGLVHRLTIDVERFWFREVFSAEEVETNRNGQVRESGWRVREGVASEAVLDLYRSESALSDAIIGGHSLEDEPAAWPEARWRDWRFHNFREILLPVITETAVHCRHVDAARELIDGRTWLVLDA